MTSSSKMVLVRLVVASVLLLSNCCCTRRAYVDMTMMMIAVQALNIPNYSNSNNNVSLKKRNTMATRSSSSSFLVRNNMLTSRPTSSRSNSRVFQLSSQHEDNDNDSDDNINSNPNPNQWTSLLVAAAFVTASLGGGTLIDVNGNVNGNMNTLVANAAETKTSSLNLVSPGTTVIETNIINKHSRNKQSSSDSKEKLLQSTESTVGKLVKTVYLNKANQKALTESIAKTNTFIQNEATSVGAWKQVYTILKDYGINVNDETTFLVRPPSDYKRAFDDLRTFKKVNLLVNGEIVQITVEYNTNTNTKTTTTNGKSTSTSETATATAASASTTESKPAEKQDIQPDDELIVKIRGYKGYDENEIKNNLRLLEKSTKPTSTSPEWYQQINNYWYSPSPIVPKDTGTNGDVIVIGGVAAIGLSYVISYSYYLEQIEIAAKEAQEKQQLRNVGIKPKGKPTITAAAAAAAPVVKLKPPVGKPKVVKPKPEKKKKKITAVVAATKEIEKAVVPLKVNVKPKPKQTKMNKNKAEVMPVVAKATAKEKETAVVKEKEKDAPTTPTSTTTRLNKYYKKPQVALLPQPRKAYDAVVEKTVEEVVIDNDDNDDDDDSVKVSIDFDKKGNVIFSTSFVSSQQQRPDSVLAFLQALYFPWMGLFFPSTSSSPSSSTYNERPKLIAFVQALYFPWGGLFFPKQQNSTVEEVDDDSDNGKGNQ